MISVSEALNIVCNNALDLGIEHIELSDISGRVLAEEIFADRPFPPFDRVCMDGIAINYNAYSEGKREFPVEKMGKAGSPQQVLEDLEKCIEIMTGAPLPMNTNTVIRFEDLEDKHGSYLISAEVEQNKNIHYRGSDHSEKAILLQPGKTLSAADVNLLATLGKTKVAVSTLPRIAVISSGDELVPISEKPKDYQIRRSNVHMLKARMNEFQISATDYHLQDDLDSIVEELKEIEKTNDVIMLCGGVSKGKLDFIPEALERSGYKKLFHRVKQRPGKPFWFGRKGDKVVFAFPGNPVSSLACFHKYFVPWLNETMRRNDEKSWTVALSKDISFKPSLTYFAQAKVQTDENAKLIVEIHHGNGSGDLVNPTQVDGFVEFPDDRSEFKRGEIFNFLPTKVLS